MLKNLKETIQNLIPKFNGFNILAIDLSMRNTGWAIGKIDADRFWPEEFSCIKTEKVRGDRFFTLEAETLQAQDVIQKLKLIRDAYNCKLVVVEMPDFSQNSQASMLIGMLWGSVFELGNEHHHLETIEPYALKEWSESARGDGKDKVTAKVLSEIPNIPPKLARNNNITDALGIALLTASITHNALKAYSQTPNS